MSIIAIPVALLSSMAIVSIAYADTKGLAEEKQCFSCHALAIQVGKAPAFKAIAKKYIGIPNVEANLVHKIRNGGEDHWGPIPMPGAEGVRPDVSEIEAKELVAWILAQH
jgi:cytochrome c